jgi:ubiquinone/menaquinone biosynthesis C-methylase UbiE
MTTQKAKQDTPQSDTAKFVAVTEIAGEEISQEQLERMCERYYWSKKYCEGKDVIEGACGTGQGLGYLNDISASFKAFDVSEEVLEQPRKHYGDRIELTAADAMNMPYEDNSADSILLFEALYYVPDAKAFFKDAARVLRPGGHLLIVNANKDLFDFNPSPHSHEYHGTVELKTQLEASGFEIEEMAGGTPVEQLSLKQKILRPVKKIVVKFGLMPKTMAGKKLLKRLVFGSMVEMPAEITKDMCEYQAPTAIDASTPNSSYKVLYCAAKLTK